jgi:hypothetical protein
MTVIARSKLGAAQIRRLRDRRPGPASGRADASVGLDSAVIAPTRATAKRRREAGAPQDQAVYSCRCGFVFEAQVSTSVGCPHCGDMQAW